MLNKIEMNFEVEVVISNIVITPGSNGSHDEPPYGAEVEYDIKFKDAHGNLSDVPSDLRIDWDEEIKEYIYQRHLVEKVFGI